MLWIVKFVINAQTFKVVVRYSTGNCSESFCFSSLYCNTRRFCFEFPVEILYPPARAKFTSRRRLVEPFHYYRTNMHYYHYVVFVVPTNTNTYKPFRTYNDPHFVREFSQTVRGNNNVFHSKHAATSPTWLFHVWRSSRVLYCLLFIFVAIVTRCSRKNNCTNTRWLVVRGKTRSFRIAYKRTPIIIITINV